MKIKFLIFPKTKEQYKISLLTLTGMMIASVYFTLLDGFWHIPLYVILILIIVSLAGKVLNLLEKMKLNVNRT